MRRKKYDTLVALSTCVIRLDVLQGHLRWKVTELARLSRIARSNIYEGLGRNKSEMLYNAVSVILDEVYGLSLERGEFERSNGLVQGFLRSRAIMMNSPELLSFYFRNRSRKDEIGSLIRRKEKSYLTKVSSRAAIKDPIHVLFVRTMIHGISLAPFLDESDVNNLMQKLSLLEQREIK